MSIGFKPCAEPDIIKNESELGKTVREFWESNESCAKITGWEDRYTCIASLRSAFAKHVRKYGGNIQLSQHDGTLYLIRVK